MRWKGAMKMPKFMRSQVSMWAVVEGREWGRGGAGACWLAGRGGGARARGGGRIGGGGGGGGGGCAWGARGGPADGGARRGGAERKGRRRPRLPAPPSRLMLLI